jgi:hypothetical protein
VKNNHITFIILSKNRINLLEKLLKNCELVFKRRINYSYLILDGSDNNLYRKTLKKKTFYKKIKIVKQKSSGFMNACFQSIKYCKTENFTFLYDDDVLGNEIYKIFKSRSKILLNFGFGTKGLLGDKNIFKKVKFKIFNSKTFLNIYYGDYFYNFNDAPVSPISNIFNKNILFLWKKIIYHFCKKDQHRSDLMLKKNIGPDLLLNLLNIQDSSNIKLFYPEVVKYASHKCSMSVKLGKNNLVVGYWLAKICFYNYSNNDLNKNYFYTFLLLHGFLILLFNCILLLSFQRNYFFFILKEINSLKKNKKKEKFIFNIFLKIIFFKCTKLFYNFLLK